MHATIATAMTKADVGHEFRADSNIESVPAPWDQHFDGWLELSYRVLTPRELPRQSRQSGDSKFKLSRDVSCARDLLR